jgi:hypothetical protein
VRPATPTVGHDPCGQRLPARGHPGVHVDQLGTGTHLGGVARTPGLPEIRLTSSTTPVPVDQPA